MKKSRKIVRKALSRFGSQVLTPMVPEADAGLLSYLQVCVFLICIELYTVFLFAVYVCICAYMIYLMDGILVCTED
jgi:hypothetical protein